jgi:hypothetical protein
MNLLKRKGWGQIGKKAKQKEVAKFKRLDYIKAQFFFS